MTTVFVYGTLKRGWDLAHLLDGQDYLGLAQTRPDYRMVALEDGAYPGLYTPAGDKPGVSVTGELWSVSDRCLAGLDRVEGVDQGYYERAPIKLLPPHDTFAAQAYFYLKPVTGYPDAGICW